MARTNVPVTAISRAGIAPAAEVNGDSVNHHSFANTNSNVILLVRNADGAGAHTVTISINETVDGQVVTARAVSIPLSASRYFGPFPAGVYGTTVLLDVDSSQLKLSAYSVG